MAFVTKRGEKSFSTGRAILPYFEESADWQFVESILEATMRERMRRSPLMGPGYVTAVEDLYRTFWHRWLGLS